MSTRQSSATGQGCDAEGRIKVGAAGDDRESTGTAQAAPAAPESSAAAQDGDEAAPEVAPEPTPEEAPAAPDPEALAGALKAALEKAAAHWDDLLRVQAEMENLRKRAQRDVESAHKYGLERFVDELLPVRDSMELGLKAAREEGADVETVREGVELTLKMLSAALDKFGVQEINPVDARFDPEYHQAMSMQEAEGVESGTVTMVVQKGFQLNGRLVRPALVMVAK